MAKKVVGALCVALGLTGHVALGATVRPMTLDSLIQQSDYVVYGRAVGSRTFWDPSTSTIWTETELLVLDGPKGHTGRSILICEPGGVLGDVGHLFPGVPRLEAGREVVAFLYNAPGNRVRVLGLLQGIYEVVLDKVTGEKVVRAHIEQTGMVSREGRAYSAQRKEPTSSRTLDEFLYSIRQKASNR